MLFADIDALVKAKDICYSLYLQSASQQGSDCFPIDQADSSQDTSSSSSSSLSSAPSSSHTSTSDDSCAAMATPDDAASAVMGLSVNSKAHGPDPETDAQHSFV